MRPPEELQIEVDERFRRRVDLAERIGQMIGVLVLILALFGFFGDGVFSRHRAGDSSSRWIEIDRLPRHDAITRLELHVRDPSPPRTEVRVSRAYFESVQIDSIHPEPEQVETRGEDLVFVFPVARAEELSVVFVLKPLRIGRAGAVVETERGSLSISQLILP